MISGSRFALTMALALSVASQAQTQTQTQTPKGRGVVATTTVTATVMSIDQATRVVTLKTPDGLESTFTVDPAVKYLAQVGVGDTVVAKYVEAVAYEVKKGGTAGASAQGVAGSAPKGSTPAGALARQVTITVQITAIDPKVPSVTFKGPQGNTRTIKVKDPSRLQGVSVGDTVEITYTEALAVTIEKAPAKKDGK